MKKLHCFLFLLLAGFSEAPFAQTAKNDTVQKPLKHDAFFASDEPVFLTLTSDFRRLRRKKEKAVFQPATAVLRIPGKERLESAVQVAARGNFRRETCAMPSLMLDFKTADTGPLARLKKMKMVCGCTTGENPQNMVLKEYLVYKIYNLLTNVSFRARLAYINYVDAGNNNKEMSQYGFFIEDVDEMAKRNKCIEYEKPVSSHVTDRGQSTLMHIFQYMIGNLDWSVPNRHNVKLVQAKSDSLSLPFAVPYDFDFCGLVDAPYAFPQEQFNIQQVTQRLYRGFPRNPDEVELALTPFREKKEAIYACINNFELLPESHRKTMTRFLDEFYRTIANEREVKTVFVEAQQPN